MPDQVFAYYIEKPLGDNIYEQRELEEGNGYWVRYRNWGNW
jgi:hypothetical protein